MNSLMLPRERVHKALSFQEPDRVPVAIGGGPYGIVDELYFRLLHHLNLGAPVPPFRQGHNISYMDDRLLKLLRTDLRYVHPTLSPGSPIHPSGDSETMRDAFGQIWRRAFPYYHVEKGILAGINKIDQIDETVRWPEPKDARWFSGLPERAKELREGTDFWVVARMITSHGPYQMACDLRGTEQFMLDLVVNPDLATAILSRIGDSLCGFLEYYLLACGPWIDMIELPGDDYAGNENLIISPKMFRQFIQPVLQRMVATVRSINPDIKIMLHSDGAIEKLIPDLIMIGIDVVHPLEPLPVTEQSLIKRTYKDQISFLGGIDISHAMPGSVEDVREEVIRCIQELAQGGGYILAPSNHLQSDVAPENVVALVQFAHQYGSYPLRIEQK